MIVHLLLDEKFTSDFIELIDKEFNQNKEHVFLIVTKHQKLRYEINNNVEKIFIRQDIRSFLRLIFYLLKADRIILHGLFNPLLLYVLYLLPVCRKAIWAIWGGDLYDYRKERGVYKYVKRRTIQRFHGVVTAIEGDADLARKVYGFKGKHYSCLMYLSNVIDKSQNNQTPRILGRPYTILIGNSADDENRHKYILERIRPFISEEVRLILPLSYGNILLNMFLQQIFLLPHYSYS